MIQQKSKIKHQIIPHASYIILLSIKEFNSSVEKFLRGFCMYPMPRSGDDGFPKNILFSRPFPGDAGLLGYATAVAAPAGPVLRKCRGTDEQGKK